MTIDNHVPTLAAIFANRLRSVAGRHYRRAYDMGIVEWRILICLGQSAPMTALQISRITDLNKAQVSRSLTELLRKDWVEIEKTGSVRRKGKIRLTPLGRELHAGLLRDAAERQRLLLAPLEVGEREIFMAALKKLIAHVPDWERQMSSL